MFIDPWNLTAIAATTLYILAALTIHNRQLARQRDNAIDQLRRTIEAYMEHTRGKV